MVTKFSQSINGVKIAFHYEGFEYSRDRKYARIRKPRVIIFREVNIVNHTNLLEISGTVILKQKGHVINFYRNLSCSGKGRKIIKRLTSVWVALDPSKETRKFFRVNLLGIDHVGEPLTVSGYIAYPQLSIEK